MLLLLQQETPLTGPVVQLTDPFGHGAAVGLTAPGKHRAQAMGAAALAPPGIDLHQVPEFEPLGLQIGGVVVTGVDHQGNPVFHGQSVAA